VALFYATDDEHAASVAERLITAAGFDPVKAGGVDQTLRLEVFGDCTSSAGWKASCWTRSRHASR